MMTARPVTELMKKTEEAPSRGRGENRSLRKGREPDKGPVYGLRCGQASGRSVFQSPSPHRETGKAPPYPLPSCSGPVDADRLPESSPCAGKN